MFYEGLGVLVREKLIDIRIIALMMSGMTQWYWEKYAPIVVEGRRSYVLADGSTKSYSRWLSETEYLYVELMKYLKIHPELKT